MSDHRPSWATEPVRLVEADPFWADLARRLRADLAHRLEPWLDGDVQHVGSTAVPGLAAKPIVDLMAPVVSVSESSAADGPLHAGGWHLVPPELDQRPWRRFYVLPQDSTRIAHLHLVERDSDRWWRTLAFRDALRAQPQRADAYAELKRALAREHRDDREAYTAAKAEFIERVLQDIW